MASGLKLLSQQTGWLWSLSRCSKFTGKAAHQLASATSRPAWWQTPRNLIRTFLACKQKDQRQNTLVLLFFLSCNHCWTQARRSTPRWWKPWNVWCASCQCLMQLTWSLQRWNSIKPLTLPKGFFMPMTGCMDGLQGWTESYSTSQWSFTQATTWSMTVDTWTPRPVGTLEVKILLVRLVDLDLQWLWEWRVQGWAPR